MVAPAVLWQAEPMGPGRGVREAKRDAFERRLIEVATRRLAESGAAGLAMRSLARDLEVTPGALYRYVKSRDELLTLLVIDAYRSLGAAVEAADNADDAPEQRWRAVWLAVRSWALEHRHEYALIYGSPVAGYAAPPETIEPASATTRALAGIALSLIHDGDSPVASASGPLAEDLARIRAWLLAEGNPAELVARVPDDALLAVVEAWTQLFGTVSFELFGHYTGSMASGEAYLDAVASRTFETLRGTLVSDP